MSTVLNTSAFLDYVTSQAAQLGVFDSVTGHEPKAAPSPTGVSCSVWVSSLRPARSGQASVSVRLELQARCFTSMLQDPQDGIDPRVTDAAGLLMNAMIGSFTLAGQARMVDVFGAEGEGLRAQAAYLTQDSKLFRVMDIFIPIIINDLWDEVA